MTYDHWKTLSPDDEFDYLNPPPEIYFECGFCNGEGQIEKWDSPSKWAIDPPSAIMVPCDVCNGAGGFVCEAESDQ